MVVFFLCVSSSKMTLFTSFLLRISFYSSLLIETCLPNLEQPSQNKKSKG